MKRQKCIDFHNNVKRSLKGMRFTRHEDIGVVGGYCLVDFRNPKVKDYGYDEVGFRILDPYKGGAIALDTDKNLVEGQIPMPSRTFFYVDDMAVFPHCNKDETMIHGAIGDNVSFAVFIGCKNTKAFWKSLRKMSKEILESGSAKGLTPKQRDRL